MKIYAADGLKLEICHSLRRDDDHEGDVTEACTGCFSLLFALK